MQNAYYTVNVSLAIAVVTSSVVNNSIHSSDGCGITKQLISMWLILCFH